VEVAQRIAAALPLASLVTIKDCGHFAYLECAGETRAALSSFLDLHKTKR
jgi:proline iminopeptidase